MENRWIDELAQQIVGSQSFSFESFQKARNRERFNEKDIEIEYDRLSLCVYHHNLSSNDYSKLCRKMTLLVETKLNKEDKKSRLEYGVLFHYFLLYSDLQEAIIEKNNRPDFAIFHNGKRIGLEITELTTPVDKVLNRITHQNFNQKLSAEEIHNNALSKHGFKANNYYYTQLDGCASIGTGTFDVNAKKQHYIERILEKYEKYKNVIGEFDDFMILCNAQHGIEITSKYDADDIFSTLKLYNFRTKFRVAILVIESNNNDLCCYEQYFG